MAALEFHHLDPTVKETIVSSDSITLGKAMAKPHINIPTDSVVNTAAHKIRWKSEISFLPQYLVKYIPAPVLQPYKKVK